jgi:hypothetical protein
VYRIRGQDSLERLVRLSLILPLERLKRDGESRYRAAKSFPELKLLFAMDAWDTWDELANEDPDEVWNQLVECISTPEVVPPITADKIEAQEVSVQSQGAVSKPEPTKKSVVSVPKEAIVFPNDSEDKPIGDIVAAPVSNDWRPPSTLSEGSGIELSKPLVTRTDSTPKLEAAIPGDQFIHQALSTKTKKPSLRFSALFILVAAVGVVVLILMQYTIQNTAQWNSVANTRITRVDRGDDLHHYGGELVYGAGIEQVEEDDSEEEEPALDDEAEASLVEPESPAINDTQILTRTLRSQISGPPREMQGEDDDLTTALMLDLSRLRGRVDRIRAPVTLWGGGEGNIPLEASVDIWLHSSGDVLRDVAIVSLAVGRIIKYYDTVVTGLSLTIVTEGEAPRRMELSGPRSAQFGDL